MDHKQIEKLMVAMGRHKIHRVALKEEGFELELEKAGPSHGGMAPPPHHHRPAFEMEQGPEVSHEVAPPKAEESEAKYITSPMVGTFYASSSPEAASFVQVGDSVDEETVVCILEAMKVMNEVKAGAVGKIAEILLKNGDPVEFGTKIFRIIT